MQASIDERHLKDFVRLLQCASKFGDELCINANQSVWELGVTNPSQSAFCLFKLQPQFFCRYQALGTPSEKRKGVKCKLLVKSVLAVLGKASTVSSIDRLDLMIHDPKGGLRAVSSTASSNGNGSVNGSNGTPRRSDIGAYDDEDYLEDVNMRGSVLVVRLVCKHGVTKKHTLNLGATDFIRVDIDPLSTPSSFTISARTLRNWLEHFSLTSSTTQSANHQVRSENHLGWMFGKNEVRLKSWEGLSKELCTEIKVDTAEFGNDRDGVASYWVEQERVDLTLPMKEFRATLQLADSMNIDLTVAFSLPNQPLTMIYSGGDEDNFDIFCAIATMNCDAFPIELGNKSTTVAAAAAPERQTTNLDPKGKRIASDLTEDGRPGPEDAEGSSAKRPRQRSDQPQSQSQGRRKASKLDLTASPRRTPQVAVVYGTVSGSSQRSGSQFGIGLQSGMNGGDGDEEINGHVGGEDGDGSNDNEPLFLDGPGSQEDHSNNPLPVGRSQSQSQFQKRVMTQQEVLQMSGFGDMTAEQLMAELDAAEDEEWTASQQARNDLGQGRVVGDLESWDDADVGNSRDGGEQQFEADDSIFGIPAFEPPPSLPPSTGQQFSPIRKPLGERIIPTTDISTDEGRYQGISKDKGKGRAMSTAERTSPVKTGPSLGPNRSEPNPGSRSGFGSGPGNGQKSPRASGSRQQARVRSETEEDREMRIGRESSTSQKRVPLQEIITKDAGIEDEEYDTEDDEAMGPSQVDINFPKFFDD